jgi:Mlc titration factor MtfA (ptsG expression regulator)
MAGILGCIILFVIVYYTIKIPRNEKKFKRIDYDDSNGFIPYENDLHETDAEYFAHLVNTLKTHFPYYKKLSEPHKRKLATRTFQIRRSKSFQGMDGFDLTSEHEILISATLAKLTLGIRNRFDLPAFELIQVYPAAFYTRIIDNYAKGLTIGNGRIFLSWRHFEEGMKDDDDKVHVGLHEFAHALMIEFDHFEYAPPWLPWCELAKPLMLEVSEQEQHFFRKYGATNIHEFWAVTVETFFEQPKEFREQYVDLYNATSAMLNQDPCARLEILESI